MRSEITQRVVTLAPKFPEFEPEAHSSLKDNKVILHY